MLALLATLIVPLPPPEYDHPYRGQLIVVEKPFSQMDRVCGKRRSQACSLRQPSMGRCIVWITPGTRRGSRTWRHEIGHCNGWPAHHPGAVRK